MTLIGDLSFNLVLNAVASFWLGLAMAWLTWRVAKPTRFAAALMVLLLPFVKLLWDIRCGVPSSSFFWASEHGIMQRLGSFQVGLGVHRWGPAIYAQLWALHGTERSPQSFADVLSRALRFRVSVYAAPAIGLGALTISLVECGKRVFGLLALRKKGRAAPVSSDRIEWRALGRRKVCIRTSSAYRGVPFAGGFFHPYVVLPGCLAERLDSGELEAVIQHELAHVRHFDLALLLPLELACAVLWFVPGMTWQLRRLRQLFEQRADDGAIALGTSPACMAEALLSVAELTEFEGPAPTLPMSRGRSALSRRVRRLLEPEASPAAKRWLVAGRSLLLLWLLLGTLQSTACGNQP